MDKGREEFEKTISGFYVKKCVENGTMEQAFYDNQFGVFKDGRQSRDEEIKECIKKYDKILSDYNLKKAEIFLLKRNFKEAQKQKTIMRNIINLRDKEIREN